MNIESLSEICNGFNSVTTDIKWEDHLCFNVADKMFLIMSLDKVPTSASFKVADEEFEEFISREGLISAPYLGRYKWVHIDDISRLSKNEWEAYAKQSYRLITSKLSKKKRAELGID